MPRKVAHCFGKETTCPIVTPSGEAVQTPASATSKRGLGREALAALLRVSNGPKCPEANLRELI